jgi:hypothetical protein
MFPVCGAAQSCSPGLHSSKTYSPVGVDTQLGSISCSNPVPPDGKRTKRFAIGAVRCDPGRKDNAPFSEVHFSSAIQKPRAVGGDVYFRSVGQLRRRIRKEPGRRTRKVLRSMESKCRLVIRLECWKLTSRCARELYAAR